MRLLFDQFNKSTILANYIKKIQGLPPIPQVPDGDDRAPYEVYRDMVENIYVKIREAAAKFFINNSLEKLKIDKYPKSYQATGEPYSDRVAIYSTGNNAIKGVVYIKIYKPSTRKLVVDIDPEKTEVSYNVDKDKKEYIWTSDPKKPLYSDSIKGGTWIANKTLSGGDGTEKPKKGVRKVQDDEEETIGAYTTSQAAENAKGMKAVPEKQWQLRVFNFIKPIVSISNDINVTTKQLKKLVDLITDYVLAYEAITEDEAKEEIVISDGKEDKGPYRKFNFQKGPIKGHVYIRQDNYTIDYKETEVTVYGIKVFPPGK